MPSDDYSIILDDKAKDGIELRGDCRRAFSTTAPQFVLSGPADTGKTWVSCVRLHFVCCKYPNSQHGMVRKTYASMPGTVLKTFERVAAGSGVVAYGGAKPERYIYPNGSTIWVGGMDKPERILSAERDSIYVNQAEELAVNEWEILGTRCTGRGAVVKTPQLHADCNPGGSKHWIKKSAAEKRLELLVARHVDNPSLYDEYAMSDAQVLERWPAGLPDGGQRIGGKVFILTESGRKRVASLSEKLTGMRRKRLFEGLWVTAEGTVYDFNSLPGGPHVKVRNANEMVWWGLAMDEGFTNPQVCLLIGVDSDGRWHVFREYYVTQQLETVVVAQAKGWWDDVRTAEVGLSSERVVKCRMCAVDAAAPGLIAALKAAGVQAKGGKGILADETKGAQISGVKKIQNRLAVQGDGLSRLTVDPSCVETINEFESYVWAEGKDVPVDKFNHSMGALRYFADVLSEPGGQVDGKSLGRIITGDRIMVDRPYTPVMTLR